MKKNTNDRKKILRLMSAYAFVMLLLVVVALTTSKNVTPSSDATEPSTSIYVQTEYVYIKVEDTNADGISDTAADTEKYIVREYMGKIGIFVEDGSLLDVIDTYVNTLPEADKRLLGEGIEIIGQQQLFEIIQDYS